MKDNIIDRRNLLLKGGAGLAAVGVVAGGSALLSAEKAAAASPSGSLLRDILDRGKLRVGTGSTNAPWHFEDENGKLVGMDIAVARIVAHALFDDANAIEFVQQDPAARIPNINTGKVDIVSQFMTVKGARAQLVAFSRPYYVEGIALLSRPDAKHKSHKAMLAGGKNTKISILQNNDAEENVHAVLPDAQVLMLDTQANVVQALDSGRVDGAAVDLSSVRWLVNKKPDRYFDSAVRWSSMLYSAAVKHGEADWLKFVDTALDVAMHGHVNDIYDNAFRDFFGESVPKRQTGFPPI